MVQQLKNAAQVIFASDSDQPVFTVWQYGLGRTAAWTSDVKELGREIG